MPRVVKTKSVSSRTFDFCTSFIFKVNITPYSHLHIFSGIDGSRRRRKGERETRRREGDHHAAGLMGVGLNKKASEESGVTKGDHCAYGPFRGHWWEPSRTKRRARRVASQRGPLCR